MSDNLYNLLAAAMDDRTPFRIKRLAWCSVIGLGIGLEMLHEYRGTDDALFLTGMAFGSVTIAAWAIVCVCEWAGITRVQRPNGSVSYNIHGGRLLALFGVLLAAGVVALVVHCWRAGWFEGPVPVTSRHR